MNTTFEGARVSADKTEKILEQVQHLIAKIEDPGVTEEEREMCRERADRLMFRYAIDEATIAKAQKAGVREKPSSSVVVVAGMFDEYRFELGSILDGLCEANRCKVFIGRDTERRNRIGTIVGFEADVRFVEMMYTSIHLTFASKVNPKWDSAKTEGQNIRTLKEAGWKWQDIATAGAFKWPDGGLMKRIYLRQLKEDGADRVVTQRHGAYRASFAEEFFRHLKSRIRALAATHQAQVAEYESETGATGTELVLSDRRSEVAEAFYALFPNARPLTEAQLKEMSEQAQKDQEEHNRKAVAARQAKLAAMTPAARRRFLAKEEADRIKAEKEEEKEYAKWLKEHYRQMNASYDASGASAGRRAAEQVDLTGGRSGIGSSEKKGIGS